MRRLVRDAALEDRIEISSAGTAGYHVGEAPDPRSRETARARGVSLESRARQFEQADLAHYDYVLAMDADNYDDLRALDAGGEFASKIALLRSFDPEDPADTNVPDPYYGGARGFDRVFDICEASCRALLRHIIEQHRLD